MVEAESGILKAVLCLMHVLLSTHVCTTHGCTSLQQTTNNKCKKKKKKLKNTSSTLAIYTKRHSFHLNMVPSFD